MQAEAPELSAQSRFAGLGLAVTLAVLAGPCASWAGLGRPFESVKADRTRMSARMASAAMATHTVSALTLPNGGVVKEFTNKAGVVFAVSWRGPGRPDLQQLLGDGFDTLQADAVGRGGRRLRAPLKVERSELVVHTGGHPGAFWGVAYLPQQTPSGFSAADIGSP